MAVVMFTNQSLSTGIDSQYLMLVNKVLEKSSLGPAKDRTGAGRIRIFSHQMRFDLRDEFPLLSLKKTHFSSIVKELAWFIKGSTNINELGCSIWDEWANTNPQCNVPVGDIGPMYGEKWRRSIGIGPNFVETKEDQLANVIAEAKRNPTSSRLIVNCWDPHLIPRSWLSVQENIEQGYMALAPCHFAFQFFCETIDGVTYMDLKPMCRSQDVFLGTPFNIASYALLLLLVAKDCGYVARELIPDMGDTHIYGNHLGEPTDQFLAQSKEFMLKRSVEQHDGTWKPVTLDLPEEVNLHNLSYQIDAVVNSLSNYNPMPHIKFARN